MPCSSSGQGSGAGELEPPGVRALVEVRPGGGLLLGQLREERLRVVRRHDDERAATRDRRPGPEDGGVPDGVRDDAHVELGCLAGRLAAGAPAAVPRRCGGRLGEGESRARVHGASGSLIYYNDVVKKVAPLGPVPTPPTDDPPAEVTDPSRRR